jgi:hypothetical protein
VAESYPGRGISIGEWSFGGERHMSGGLAVAEALGRFGQGGVDSAFYWTYPPAGSPAYWAFRAYRDFDGRGGHFLDWSLVTEGGDDLSIFASRDDTGAHLVAVILNTSPGVATAASVELRGCGERGAITAFTYSGAPRGFEPLAAPGQRPLATAPKGDLSEIALELVPYSINVIDVSLAGHP